MQNLKYLILFLLVSSCASAIYTVGDRENPNERFANILSGVSYYRALEGKNKAFASNIGVRDTYPFRTTAFGFGGFCYDKATKEEAIECAINQCKTNVGGINQYGGYGSLVKDCTLMYVNDDYVFSESIKEFDDRKGNSIRDPLLREYNYKIAQQKRKKELEQARRQQQIAQQEAQRQREIEKQMALWTEYINQKKAICMSYGFNEENAIASCVQTEINNEIMRMQQVQAYANAQARANAAQRSNALSNMGRCLSTEGNFGACANAWQGYTPPKVTNCQYDVFGNVIRSTCKTQ